MRLIQVPIALLVALLGIHVAAQDVEPPDLRVELRTAAGSDRFQLGEVIPLEVSFSSTSANRYLEPCELFTTRAFGYPQCRFFSTWKFGVSPSDGVVDLWKEFGGRLTHSGPLFEVPSHDLTAQPSVYSYPLTNRFRFDRPGQYRILFSTEVGLDDETTRFISKPGGFGTRPTVKPHSIAITRELVLNIVPAEAAWETSVIERGVEAFSKRGVQDTRESEFKTEESARLALCTLGTPEALRAMARLFAKENPQFVRICRDSANGRAECYNTAATVNLQQCIRQARDTSPAVDEMQKLLVAPEVAVRLDFFNLLVALFGKDPGQFEGMLIIPQSFVDLTREKLFAALPQKRSEAFLPSLVTVLSSPSRTRGSAGEGPYELTFSPPIVATIAEHFDELPNETRQLLLIDSWDRIHSPLMIPVVRRRAESGDGEALLRWLELDPQNATAFIHEEIVRPVPRFSSYYLRLPEPSLPAAEQKLADNFLALVAKHTPGYPGDANLARSASLLQRYASGKVLPAVLPAIDSNLAKWPCPAQVPVVAYLLKVAPKDVESRVTQALPTSERSQCANTFLSSIGRLQRSPVLERVALEQVARGKDPLARDGAVYLRRYASQHAKSAVWDLLVRWTERANRSGAEGHIQSGKITAEESEQLALVSELAEAYVAAQAWVLTPEEADAFRKLVGEKRDDAQTCRFHCGDQLSVALHKGQFAIYGGPNRNTDRVEPPLEYLNPYERLRYSVNQYGCASMQALKDKLLQFPGGSEFVFAWDFTPRDRDEIVEISDFLRQHGYKVANPWHWPFLSPELPR